MQSIRFCVTRGVVNQQQGSQSIYMYICQQIYTQITVHIVRISQYSKYMYICETTYPQQGSQNIYIYIYITVHIVHSMERIYTYTSQCI
jgi:hypothetical protein